MSKLKACSAAVITFCSALLTGCSQNNGQRTFEYLSVEHAIIEDAKHEFANLPAPKPPAQPVIPDRANPRVKNALRKKYRQDQIAFLKDLNYYFTSLESLCNQTETKMANIDATGVDHEAVDLVQSYEKTFGDAAQVAIEFKAISQMGEDDLSRNPVKELMPELMIGLVEACAQDWAGAAKSALAGTAGVINRTVSEVQEMQAEVELLKKDAVAFDCDKSKLVTVCSEIKTSYSAKYPKFAWRSTIPTPSDTTSGISSSP